MDWLQLILAALVGLGFGGLWQRRHATREAEKQRAYTSAEARATREHASAEAQASRRFQIRLDAYKEASKWLERQRLWVQLTEPISTSAPEPDVMDDAVEFAGTISVTASDDVRLRTG